MAEKKKKKDKEDPLSDENIIKNLRGMKRIADQGKKIKPDPGKRNGKK